MDKDWQNIDQLFASKLKGFAQAPPEHVWTLIESELDDEYISKTDEDSLQKLLMKFRIGN